MFNKIGYSWYNIHFLRVAHGSIWNQTTNIQGKDDIDHKRGDTVDQILQTRRSKCRKVHPEMQVAIIDVQFHSFLYCKEKIIITRRNYLNIIIPNFNFNRPEYKIPGLYVIDSIVRQSRHQFGPDKDVFAPRFAKNIQLTFYHLYKCSEEEKVYISLVSFLIFLNS